MYAKPGRLLEALDKVRKADAVPETNARKSGRLAQALQKVRETYAAEAEAGTGAPRGVKAFTRMKAAVAESQVMAADDVVAKLTRRVNKMANLTPDVVKPQSPAPVEAAPVEVKLPVLREPEKEKKEVRVMTPRMKRLVVEMSAKPASPRTVLPCIEVRREVTLVHGDGDSRTWRVSYVEYEYK